MEISVYRELAVLMLLSVNTFSDLKREEIILVSIPVGMGAGLICAWLSGDFSLRWLTGLIPGAFTLLMSILSHGAVGMGDALLLLTLGTLLPVRSVSACLLSALMLSFPGAAFLIMRKNNKHDSLPFVPFMLAGHLLTFICQGGIA